MCYFVTLGVREKFLEDLEAAFARGYKLSPTENASLNDAFPKGFVLRVLTAGGCSCSLYASRRKDSLREKYLKRGWDEDRIKRAIQQAPKDDSGLNADVSTRLQTVLNAAGEIGVFVHWYKGDIETERLDVNRTRVRAASGWRSHAAALAENELMLVAERVK